IPVFTLVLLGTGSFDGFNETFVWLDLIGVNPLAFPGRSAVVVPVILGLAGGFGCYIAVDIIRGKLKIDDSLDVFAVHGVGGIIGSLLVAFLALPIFGGLGLADGATAGSQFMVQLASVAITIAWTLVVSAVILMIAKTVTGLRVDEQTEVDGLDLAEHGERGYPGN
ncbi:MAG: hypothetical protein QF801_06705, partial [Alphaproteobacteria bacterium]|nr:hypothetical protein [Alphaproteobacteria bacterium]